MGSIAQVKIEENERLHKRKIEKIVRGVDSYLGAAKTLALVDSSLFFSAFYKGPLALSLALTPICCCPAKSSLFLE